MSAALTAGFYIYSDVETQGPGYLKTEAAEPKEIFWTMGVHTRFPKITIFSIRVGSMGSMEARGRLSLPCGSKWCVWRAKGCTLAPNYNLHMWGRALGAGEVEDGGGAAATGELPWAGKGFSRTCSNSPLLDALCKQQAPLPSFGRLCGTFWPLSCPRSFLAVPVSACWEMCTLCWVKEACVFPPSSLTLSPTADITCLSDSCSLQLVHIQLHTM